MKDAMARLLGLLLAVLETACPVAVADSLPRPVTFVGRIDGDHLPDLIIPWGLDGHAIRLPLANLPAEWAHSDLRTAVVSGLLVEVGHRPLLIVDTIEEPR